MGGTAVAVVGDSSISGPVQITGNTLSVLSKSATAEDILFVSTAAGFTGTVIGVTVQSDVAATASLLRLRSSGADVLSVRACVMTTPRVHAALLPSVQYLM